MRTEADQGRCLEWLKLNAPAEVTREPVALDLFGASVQSNERPKTTSSKRQRFQPEPQTPAPPPLGKPPLVCNVTDEEIASFKALGVEVCIRTESLGDVHLVPNIH